MPKKTAPASGGIQNEIAPLRRARRFKPGTVALREVKKY